MDKPVARKRKKFQGEKRGRRVDPVAREQVLELLGDKPRRRDLLIEHLHLIQDKFGHIAANHITALASEMKLA
ncbi:MAG: NADH-quinone oxidoreductase subunit F, partial [Pseudomonadota bacterium]